MCHDFEGWFRQRRSVVKQERREQPAPPVTKQPADRPVPPVKLTEPAPRFDREKEAV